MYAMLPEFLPPQKRGMACMDWNFLKLMLKVMKKVEAMQAKRKYKV